MRCDSSSGSWPHPRTRSSERRRSKAFEFTYELSWKLVQARLLEEGVAAATPRATFRAAGDAGLVASVERWLDYLDARNLTSHTYNQEIAEQVYAVIAGGFVEEVQALLADRG